MIRLSEANLPEHIETFRYNRNQIKSGIVHFGIGNFHRAHQAVYCDALLNQGETNWGITGISLRSDTVQQALDPQDYLYTLATLGRTTEYRIVGSIKNVLVAPNDPQAVIDHIVSPDTQLVSSTITEKGYYLSANGIDFENEVLKEDSRSLTAPKTLYGFIAAGIIGRSKSNDEKSKLTVLCCDNISHGGNWIEKGVYHLLRQHDPIALTWAKDNVSFISSMVDRVSPATTDTLRETVQHSTHTHDAWPVSAEPYTQWIIENKFAGERPKLDSVGAVFVKDITLFEQMKLRYLNAAHSIVSTLGYLCGDTYVHETLKRPKILNFTRNTLTNSILPNTNIPDGQDGHDYIQTILERFHNSALPYANLQVGTDTSLKIQQRWFPTIDAALNGNADLSYFAFCLAAWVTFIRENVENGTLKDPQEAQLSDLKYIDDEQIVFDCLNIANAQRFDFYRSKNFMEHVVQHYIRIKMCGVENSLQEYFDTKMPR